MNDDIHTEQNIEEAPPDDRKGFITWVEAHKKQLIFVGLSIPTIIAIVLGLKNKEAIMELWGKLEEEIRKANLHSSKWFEKATDADLSLERDKVRQAYCSSGDDFEPACNLQNLLWRFDKELSKRAWGDEIPHAPSIHREHGWYLPNDD